ncbi:phosphodiester glycosidase family protein [Acinetobacter sp. C_4_1]|uniref:phosphodiester glycosidase family protein n=1 Tax=unclassified Acinetobacter TaxID=196816 RepID=UPI0021B757CC|nr:MULTISPECIES: phosphodiester glycosidase family protein [unclassified Acinetobacter]MCT8089178.1 phosphodiester glycosidase family protein [Acinetobacter sp. F_3_1]MCT8097333.1 phosphodiester glycosidase family protein [Acinetobacter sp. C_3_1]MCT8100209.1 phosphodiester glycosidase family protein [Acinetobacter sp. C_4_1]MCT8133399.1 phosphodiester glycosidase family protein [Acinetobacter sp. T_3_1]
MKGSIFFQSVAIAVFGFNSISHAQVESQHFQNDVLDVDIVKIDQPKNLRLFLNDAKTHQPLGKFSAVQKQLKPCEKLLFAMNAGMYHADYSAVGLYIEASQQQQKLNTVKQGYGNFHIQPNGVLAWNSRQSLITKTEDYQKLNFNAEYATQSGPMLVIDGQINPNFLKDSDSLKIRNAVGIKDQSLYFVISRNAVSFYQFAQFFQQQLKVQNALYLDGSISSAYIPQLKRSDSLFHLGPMVAYIDQQNCSTE